VAYHQGQEVGHRTSVPGQNASARDTAFQALADAASLAKDLLVGSSSPSSILILTADHLVLPYCQITDCHNNAMTCRTICDSVSAIAAHTTTTLSISWIPSKISFRLLECLMTIGVEAAAQATLDFLTTAPMPNALQTKAWQTAINDWESVWLEDPHTNPAY
jgi:hypothetical protein